VAFSARIQTTRPPAGAPLRNTRNSHGTMSVSMSHQQKRKKQGQLTTAGAILKNQWYKGFSQLGKPYAQRWLNYSCSATLIYLSSKIYNYEQTMPANSALPSAQRCLTFNASSMRIGDNNFQLPPKWPVSHPKGSKNKPDAGT
jgi:hypothetical protein